MDALEQQISFIKIIFRIVFSWQDDNLIHGFPDTAGGNSTGGFVAMTVCGASAGVLCIPGSLGGIYQTRANVIKKVTTKYLKSQV